MASRDELLQRQFARDAEQGPTFAARMRARSQLHAHGWGEDPWTGEVLAAELTRASATASSVAEALAEVGRALLANDRFEELAAWLDGLTSHSRDDAEAAAVMRAMLAIRAGENEEAAALLTGIPLEEAVALHGLALLQLGKPDEAAARLEALLAADGLDEQGEVAPHFLPEPMPALALFLTACVTAAERRLAQQDRDGAERFALAARDALRRYASAEPPEGPSREEVAALVARVTPG